ncbi:MAG: hypothetical protein RML95_10475 [Anaerolineae bacterium]|nr:hypothetical protein [Anaerolineae bacterium]MDW8299750.1 hypothetical protein [Anaerolineae bacterium]
MQLTAEHLENIRRFVPIFRYHLNQAEQNEELLERAARRELYQQLLSPEALRSMTELELGQVIGSLWANRLWVNKRHFIENLIAANGLPALIKHLSDLLWGKESVGRRYDTFRRAIKGLGTASITELLAIVHPEQCGIWNDKARRALNILGMQDILPFTHKQQINGEEYERFNRVLKLIGNVLEQLNLTDLDYPKLDYFLYIVWESGSAETPFVPQPSATPEVEDFDHDQVVENLLKIGESLGFSVEKEKLVARGAKVDAIWQTRIANLGVVTYVFEVQRRGSLDSLILNLQRAQNNPTVQRLIVVANANSLERIRNEIATLPESFRKLVSYMEVKAVQRAVELIDELTKIIGRLELVRDEFDVRP